METKITEAMVLRSCLDYLSLRGIFHWRQNQAAVPLPGGGYRRFVGKKGISDIIAIVPPNGTFCAIEIKSPSGRVSSDQKKFHQDVVALGGIAMCVSSVEELIADLKEAGVS